MLTTSGRSEKLRIVRRSAMHRLPHAAGVKSRRRDRQGHWDKQSHQQQNQQQSRSQTMHRLFRDAPSKNKLSAMRVQVFRLACGGIVHCDSGCWDKPCFSRLAMNLGPPPAQANKQETPVVKEFRLLVLKRVANELKRPSHKEKHKRIKPQPVNKDAREEQSDRSHNRRYPQRMAYPVHRVLMAARILRDPLFIRARFVAAASKHGDLNDTRLQTKSGEPNAG